jgi:hypothetical protein
LVKKERLSENRMNELRLFDQSEAVLTHDRSAACTRRPKSA